MKIATILISFFVLFFSFSLEGAGGAKFFKWTDREGVVHFSDRPPEEGSQFLGDDVQERIFENSPAVEDAPEEPRPHARARSPIEYAARSTFTIESSGSYGSGFFITSDGYAVTCKHVVQDGTNHIAVLTDQSRRPVKVISESPTHDLALILVLTDGSTDPLPLRDAKSLVTGDRILAIGAPVGLASTVTDGIFTGFRRIEGQGDELIQFSAPVNPGNSGGPLVDEEGRVVGIVTSKFLGSEGAPLSGLGFALPSGYILESYNAYILP